MKTRGKILAVLLSVSMAGTSVMPAMAEELTDGSDENIEAALQEPESELTDSMGSFYNSEEVVEDVKENAEEEVKHSQEIVKNVEVDGKILGVFIENYKISGDNKELENKYYWDAADGTWSSVEGDDKKDLLRAGEWNFLGETVWNIIASETTGIKTKASGGYVLDIEKGSWKYYLDKNDVTGLEVQELPVYTTNVPSEFFVGAAAADQRRHAGLYEKNNKKEVYYLEKEGTIVKNDVRVIGSTKYYFGADGKCEKKESLQDARWVKKEDGYYWQNEDGTILEESGWKELGGKQYYLGENGRRTEGWAVIEKKKYYFVPGTGQVKKGWSTIDGKKYYFEKDGHQTIGWRSFGGKKYYFIPGTGQMKKGWSTIDGEKYYFEKDGHQTKGWRTLGGKMYYFVEKTGKMKKGWLTLGDTKYYFNKDGSRFSGVRSVGGKKYYLQKNGKLLINKKCYEISGKFYDIDKNGVMKEVAKVKSLAAKVLKKEGRNLDSAFKWASALKYDKKNIALADGVKEVDHLAVYGFENKKGNRFVMASTFYQMAKILGYDVHYVKGKIQYKSGKLVSHGWCEIDKDGKVYVCDPYFAHEGGKNGLMFTYGDKGTWIYKNYYRVN